MKARLVRIGNSRGIRIPRELLDLYHLGEGDEVELQRRRNGILLHPVQTGDRQLSYADSYREMADEAAEAADWDAWDASVGDGLDR